MAIRRHDKLETPISTMLDVVFLLIIFFVVTAALDAEIMDSTIKLCQAKFTPVPKVGNPKTIYINVRKGNRVTMGIGQRVDMTTLTNTLKIAKNNYRDVPIVIRSEGDVPYGEIDRIMKAIEAAQLYRVSLSAAKRN